MCDLTLRFADRKVVNTEFSNRKEKFTSGDGNVHTVVSSRRELVLMRESE